jgi:hypothetical protein
MKALLLIIGAIAFTGCAIIKVHVQRGPDVYDGIGISCFKDIKVDPLTFGADGSVQSMGYRSGVDGESLGEAGGTLVKVLAKP